MAVKLTAYCSFFLFRGSFKQTEQPSASRHVPLRPVSESVYLSLQLLLLTSEYLWELEGVTANCPVHKREAFERQSERKSVTDSSVIPLMKQINRLSWERQGHHYRHHLYGNKASFISKVCSHDHTRNLIYYTANVLHEVKYEKMWFLKKRLFNSVCCLPFLCNYL